MGKKSNQKSIVHVSTLENIRFIPEDDVFHLMQKYICFLEKTKDQAIKEKILQNLIKCFEALDEKSRRIQRNLQKFQMQLHRVMGG